MAKPSKPNYALYGGLVIVVGLAVALNSGGDPATTSTKKPVTAKKAAAKMTPTGGDGTVTSDDYTATFAAYSATPKTSFNPVIKRTGGVGGAIGAGPVQSNKVPPEFCDGDGNWIYTGNATLDGNTQALLENTTTGEGVFLHVGQSWKNLVLKEIREDSIFIMSPDGDAASVDMLTTPKDDSSVKPMRVDGSGSTPIAVLPDPTAMTAPPGMPAFGASPTDDGSGNNGGGRGRGRRGRNGGGQNGG